MVVPEIPPIDEVEPVGLLAFEFGPPGGSAEERLVLAPDGHVTRTVMAAAGEQPAIGLWTGTLDDSVLALAHDVASRSWASAPTVGSAPAAGAWTAGASGQSVGLWGGADDVRGPLQSVLGACVVAASHGRGAVAFRATSADGDPAMPMLHVTSQGDEAVAVVVDVAEAEGTAAFLTADATTVGFLGGEIALEPGAEAFAALGVPGGEDSLSLNGSLRSEGRDDLRFRASVLVARG